MRDTFKDQGITAKAEVGDEQTGVFSKSVAFLAVEAEVVSVVVVGRVGIVVIVSVVINVVSIVSVFISVVISIFISVDSGIVVVGARPGFDVRRLWDGDGDGGGGGVAGGGVSAGCRLELRLGLVLDNSVCAGSRVLWVDVGFDRYGEAVGDVGSRGLVGCDVGSRSTGSSSIRSIGDSNNGYGCCCCGYGCCYYGFCCKEGVCGIGCCPINIGHRTVDQVSVDVLVVDAASHGM
jgi:hypothetical protein